MSGHTHTTESVTGSNLLPVALIERDGEPRALDTDIAARLGMSRPRDIRKILARHRGALESFGALVVIEGSYRGQRVDEYHLNEEQALYAATVSEAPNAPAVRVMLIRTFVAWRRGHLHSAVPATASLPAQLGDLIQTLVNAEVARHNLVVRRGKTAGQIWKEAGFPPIRIGGWFSRKLLEMGCAIEGGGYGELGLATARLFDPDRSTAWLRNGGRLMVEMKLAERMGQGKLKLVRPAA